MGYNVALDFALNADERTALSWHLSANHYPPVPTSMVDACTAAINAAMDEEWDREIELPAGVSFKGRPTAPASAIIEQHHLQAFIDARMTRDAMSEVDEGESWQ